jgi:hypothetical protein
MEATWQHVGAMPPSRALRLQQAQGKQQQELIGFVIAYSSELRPEVSALVHYIFVVLVEAFHRSAARFRTIKPNKVVREWQVASAMFASVSRTDDLKALEIASQSSEPAAYRYVLDALGPEQEDPIILTSDELRQSLAILATVINCLHDGQKTR